MTEYSGWRPTRNTNIRADVAEASVVTMTAAMTTLGESRNQGTGDWTQLVDNNLGHPKKFSGEDKYWPDWSFVVLDYVGSLSGQLVRLMNEAALSELQVDWDLQTDVERKLDSQLFYFLTMLVRGRGVGEAEEAS